MNTNPNLKNVGIRHYTNIATPHFPFNAVVKNPALFFQDGVLPTVRPVVRGDVVTITGRDENGWRWYFRFGKVTGNCTALGFSAIDES